MRVGRQCPECGGIGAHNCDRERVMGDVIEQAADRIDSTWTFEGHDPGEDRPAIQIARALEEAGLLRSDAEQAVIAAADQLHDIDCMFDEPDAVRAVVAAVAALRAARKETP